MNEEILTNLSVIAVIFAIAISLFAKCVKPLFMELHSRSSNECSLAYPSLIRDIGTNEAVVSSGIIFLGLRMQNVLIRAHSHPFGRSNGISSSIHFTVPSANFS